MLFRQVKISCYATKGNERRQGGGGYERPEHQGWGFLSGRGWRRVGGNVLKRKSGLIMRVGGEVTVRWVRVERLTEMFKLA